MGNTKNHKYGRRRKKFNVPHSKRKEVTLKAADISKKIKFGQKNEVMTAELLAIFLQKAPFGSVIVAAIDELQPLQTLVDKITKKNEDALVLIPPVDNDMRVIISPVTDIRSAWRLSDHNVNSIPVLKLIRQTISKVHGNKVSKQFAQILGPGGARQAFHADNPTFFTDLRLNKKNLTRIESCDVPYSAILSFNDTTSLWLYDAVTKVETNHIIPAGHLFLWRGDVFHAGAETISHRIFYTLQAKKVDYCVEILHVLYSKYCLDNNGKIDYSSMPHKYAKAIDNDSINKV